MTMRRTFFIAACAVICRGLQSCKTVPVNSVNNNAVDFGNDSSQWAFDGECDDPRFSGPGMTRTVRLDEDKYRDATDCRSAFNAGTIWLAGQQTGSNYNTSINFGDDNGQWAFDGECDDSRFHGPGMTQTPLLDEDRYHDATDCRSQYDAGRLALR